MRSIKKELLTKLIGQMLMCLIMMAYPFFFVGCSDDKEEGTGENMITVNEDQLSFSLEAEDTYTSVSFTALASWTAALKETNAASWLTLSADKGIGGMMKIGLTLKKILIKKLVQLQLF
ncbi:MAG: hypothetical protein LUH50_14635 [Bacteroides intestinalis]|nr:hypothetical protein [Bacteroides intestinalis]